jgi:tRNA threonylcarbamoyladenosine biosynthesis protein TsaB
MTDVCALAIEAATDQFSLAACRAGRFVCWETRPARDETQRIYEHAGRLLAESGASLKDLDFVSFGCGPGSFTGVRMAAAAAQAIAFARSIPVCRLSSLAVLAAGAARATGADLVAPCLNARMERAYVALYSVAPGKLPQAIVRDRLISPGDFALPGDMPFTAVGDGWRAYPAILARHESRLIAVDAELLPSARDLLSMAIVEFHAGRTVTPQEALPEYLGQAPGMRA